MNRYPMRRHPLDLTQEILQFAKDAGFDVEREVRTDGFKGYANEEYKILIKTYDPFSPAGFKSVEIDVTDKILHLVLLMERKHEQNP